MTEYWADAKVLNVARIYQITLLVLILSEIRSWSPKLLYRLYSQVKRYAALLGSSGGHEDCQVQLKIHAWRSQRIIQCCWGARRVIVIVSIVTACTHGSHSWCSRAIWQDSGAGVAKVLVFERLVLPSIMLLSLSFWLTSRPGCINACFLDLVQVALAIVSVARLLSCPTLALLTNINSMAVVWRGLSSVFFSRFKVSLLVNLSQALSFSWAYKKLSPEASFASQILTQGTIAIALALVALVCELSYEREARSNVVLEKLLDFACDGFCTVDLSTGVIQTSSPQLLKTLGPCASPGRRLMDWAEGNGNDQRQLQKLLIHSLDSAEVHPVLVTLMLEADGVLDSTPLLDAKIIPYTVAGGTLDLCIQVQGEARRLYLERTQSPSMQTAPRQDFADSDDNVSSTTLPDSVYDRCRRPFQVQESELAYSESAATEISEWTLQTGSSGSGGLRAKPAHYFERKPPISTTSIAVQIDLPPIPANVSNAACQTEAGSSKFLSNLGARPPRPPSEGTPNSKGKVQSKLPRGNKQQSCSAHQTYVSLSHGHVYQSQYAETKSWTMRVLLIELMEKTNPRGRSCCFWHLGLAYIMRAAKCMLKESCPLKLISPNKSWQCQECSILHEEELSSDDDTQAATECSYCGAAKVILQTDQSADQGSDDSCGSLSATT